MITVTHGTAGSYRRGCRCSLCREHSARTRRLHRQGLGPGKTPPGLQVHGKFGYARHGCRCPICTAANTEAQRLYRQRRKMKSETAPE